MSRPVLLLVVIGLLSGACLLTRSIIAAHRLPVTVPDVEPASSLPAPALEPLPPDACPRPPETPPPETPAAPPALRPWGQEQACGPPDSPQGGDVPTAWAPASADNQNEWLELTYPQPVRPIAVLVFEACGPGALSQIEFLNPAGEWVTVWGDDPRPVGGSLRIVNAAVEVDFATARVRVSILSTMVPGWNEIDAVGLLDAGGNVHWALAASASSSYAGESGDPFPAY